MRPGHAPRPLPQPPRRACLRHRQHRQHRLPHHRPPRSRLGALRSGQPARDVPGPPLATTTPDTTPSTSANSPPLRLWSTRVPVVAAWAVVIGGTVAPAVAAGRVFAS